MKKLIHPGFNATFELRNVGDEGTILVGRAVPYDEWSQAIYGYFKEKFKRGAFTDTLRSGKDVYASIDHNTSNILARTSQKTLTLEDRDDGLYVECKLPNTTYGRDLTENVKHGNIRGMSFIFTSVTEQWAKEDGMNVRVIEKADLYEVCFTGFPAYPTTSAGLRSMGYDFVERLQFATPNLDEARVKFFATIK